MAKAAKALAVLEAAKFREWEEYGEGGYLAVNKPQPKRHRAARPGIYQGAVSVLGPMLLPMEIITDKLLDLPSPEVQRILSSVKKFWQSRARYELFGQLYKRGILMHSLPGAGKTVTLMFLAQDLVKEGGIVIYFNNPGAAVSVLKSTREREPERPLIAIFEDLDDLIAQYGDTYFTSLLDGEHKVENIVYLATTNYLNKLDTRIRNRPSRFDEVVELPMPHPALREAYFRQIMQVEPIDEVELREWVDNSAGLSIAHLKELVISVKVLGNSFPDTLTRLKALGAALNETATNDETDDDD